jgi:carboxypeptidase Taq
MENKFKELKIRLLEINDLNMATALLRWDHSTYMPPGGATARGRQLATLSRLAQEKFIDPAMGNLLDDLRPYEESRPYDSDEASLIRVTRRFYERAIKAPPDFMAEFNRHSAESYQVWAKARPENNFAAVQPMLEKTLDLSRQYANFYPGYEHIADPLIDITDYGMTVSTLRPLFAELREQLPPLVEAIVDQPPADDSCLHQDYPEDEQLAFGLNVIKQYGYDFNRGRQDKTRHPFMTKFSLGDVRITTRVKENDLSEALFSTLHEAGHALYEQGINMDYEGTPLARGTSSGVHESQSRLWENQVGRSWPFWKYYYPQLQTAFPQQLGDTSLETFHRAINKVRRSLIRTDADEVTYNLHVMIRFELELSLLEGKLAIKDLPDAWHAHYQQTLGICAPNDSDGVLQDVHWYAGKIGGAFQGYTLGNIIAALFFEAAQKTHPDIPAQIEQGEFSLLHTWLKENIYRHGHKFTALELIERITGGPLTIEPYIRYLWAKFEKLYKITASRKGRLANGGWPTTHRG